MRRGSVIPPRRRATPAWETWRDPGRDMGGSGLSLASHADLKVGAGTVGGQGWGEGDIPSRRLDRIGVSVGLSHRTGGGVITPSPPTPA